MTGPMKVCSMCRQELPSEAFAKDSSRKDGLQRNCKPCVREYGRRHRAKPEVAAHRAQRAREWAKANPEKRLAASRASKRRTPPEIRTARWQSWAERNRERLAERDRRRKQEERQKFRDYEAARRARRRDQFVEHVDSAVLYERDNGICGICNEPVDKNDFQIDHVIPLCQGGEHSYANTQVAHAICNVRKPRGPRRTTQSI
jgi:5-methylcytosine-specific restriction endonuclease McrA